MDIRIGVPVQAEDGEVGRVERIILHPQTQEVDAVVAAEGSTLTRDVVIPIDRVLAADERGVWVRGSAEEISGLDPFAQSQYVEPPEDWIPPEGGPASFYLFPASPYAVGAFQPSGLQPPPSTEEVEDLAEGNVDLTGATTVRCQDGEAGHVGRVLTQGNTDVVTHLVVQRGGLRPRPVAVPVEQVTGMEGDVVELAMSLADLDHFPTYEE